MSTVRMSGFHGLYQDGDGVGLDPRYARVATNVETSGGVLASAARAVRLRAELARPIGTLMRLHRRWHAGEGPKDLLVAASGGRLYWMALDGQAWSAIAMPLGIDAYQSDAWSFLTYEINPEGSEAPVDVLLISNAKDGMYCLRGDDMTVSAVPTPRKFGVIARYAERIWGGAIEDDPDMLVYSAPYNPFDWSQNDAIPEDGAGDVQQPSWDGDGFTALTQFGAQLIAIKGRRVFRILGTDPGQYAFYEQFGGGTAYPDTVAVDGERIWMLGDDGVLRYDGLSVTPYGRAYAKGVFDRMNRQALDRARACMYKEKYYCALPLDGSPMNSAVLVFDTYVQSWLLREGDSVEAFLPTEDGLFFTSAEAPGRVFRWGEDAQKTGAVAPAKWVGPWLDLGAKQAIKGGWTVSLAPDAPSPAELLVTVRTEKKARTKALRVKPGGRTRKLVFGGGGKRWRLEIESYGTVAWRISGGISVDVEVDA